MVEYEGDKHDAQLLYNVPTVREPTSRALFVVGAAKPGPVHSPNRAVAELKASPAVAAAAYRNPD